jgi:hypothetical protein
MAKIFHALTREQRLEMLKSGFLAREIKEFDRVRATDWNSRAFGSMVKDRRDWRDAMLLNGWTPKEIFKRLAHWYRLKKQRSPWDFFRLEYSLTISKPKLNQSQFRDYLNNRAAISRGFGKAYGRIKSVKLSQRYGLPGVPKKR